MQLARYKAFLNELKTDSNVSLLADDITVYRQWNDVWFDESDTEIESGDFSDKLEKTLVEGQHWRPTSSILAYFPLSTFHAVAIVGFQTMTTQRTRDKFQSELNRCLDVAQKAFDASHFANFTFDKPVGCVD